MVVVGSGYIGLEMAEALIRHGLEVSLISRPPQIMGTLDDDMGALVSQALRDVGVSLYLEETLIAFKTKDGKVTGVVTDKRSAAASAVLGRTPKAEGHDVGRQRLQGCDVQPIPK